MKSISAKYDTSCGLCSYKVWAGDQIIKYDLKYSHAECVRKQCQIDYDNSDQWREERNSHQPTTWSRKSKVRK